MNTIKFKDGDGNIVEAPYLEFRTSSTISYAILGCDFYGEVNSAELNVPGTTSQYMSKLSGLAPKLQSTVYDFMDKNEWDFESYPDPEIIMVTSVDIMDSIFPKHPYTSNPEVRIAGVPVSGFAVDISIPPKDSTGNERAHKFMLVFTMRVTWRNLMAELIILCNKHKIDKFHALDHAILTEYGCKEFMTIPLSVKNTVKTLLRQTNN